MYRTSDWLISGGHFERSFPYLVRPEIMSIMTSKRELCDTRAEITLE